MPEDPIIIEDQKVLIQATDPLGEEVLLFETRWVAKIILEHPITLDDVRVTITDPDFIEAFGGDRRYYRKSGGRRYFLAISKPYRGHNGIATAFVSHHKQWPEARLIYVRLKPSR